VNLSKKQQNLLLSFRRLLEFGYSILKNVPLDLDKVRLKKKILYLTMGAVQSYSEVISLISFPDVYDKAAEVLIRSLVEASINIDYIYSKRDESRARIFVVHSIKDKIDFAKKYQSLIRKHSSWNLKFGDKKSIKNWQQFISVRDKEIKILEKKYNQNFPKFIGVRNKAICADNYLKDKGFLSENKSQETLYVKYYKFFSQVAHLTSPGLGRFYNPEDSTVLINGNVKDMERIILIIYQLYFSFLIFFSKKFEVYNNQNFKKYKEKSKTLLQYNL